MEKNSVYKFSVVIILLAPSCTDISPPPHCKARFTVLIFSAVINSFYHIQIYISMISFSSLLKDHGLMREATFLVRELITPAGRIRMEKLSLLEVFTVLLPLKLSTRMAAAQDHLIFLSQHGNFLKIFE